eukprot:m.302476 g.302476  ORF g.302476 m.302476 type:complete len:92 (-) comp16435_c0_seq24:5208-5483(-)
MVYCLHHFAPFLFLPPPSESILTQPFIVSLLLFTIIFHRPCIQCTILFAVTCSVLCYSGRSQYCIFNLVGSKCHIDLTTDASMALCSIAVS